MAQKKKAQKAKPVKKKPSKKVPKEAKKEKPKQMPKKVPEETPKEAPKKVPRETRAENVVLIGRKPVMNYVVACITFFNSGGKEVTVKARGRAISRAVDTIELLRRAFVKDLEVESINIDTEEIQREEGGTRNVSTIEITVAKTGSK